MKSSDQILVSVIVPVYNVERYLKRCVESILEQTHKNIEIILIDDGSTDSSGMICDEYSKTEDLIKVVHKENEGLGRARNTGMEYATGDYFMFVDSDDDIAADTVESLLGDSLDNDCELTIGNFIYNNEAMPMPLEQKTYRSTDVVNIVLLHLLGSDGNKNDNLSVSACGNLYKKSVISENNITFPSEWKLIWEDMVFNMHLLPHLNAVFIDHRPYYTYYYNETSTTHKYDSDKLNKILTMYEYMGTEIKKIQFSTEDIAELARQRFLYGIIGNIRTALKLEVLYRKQNGFRRTVQNIGKALHDKRLISIINAYPVSKYSRQQRIYDIAMKRKNAMLVYILTWVQNARTGGKVQ